MSDQNQYSALAKLHPLQEILATPEPRWLVEGFIHEDEVGFLWGEPNCGKTFVALDLACHIALGKKWLNSFPVLSGPVIYLCGEGAGGMKKRLEAWMEYHKVRDIPGLYFITRALPLREEDAVQAVRDALHVFFNEDGEDEGPRSPEDRINPRLIVVDTLSQYFGSGDEVGHEMRDLVQVLRSIAYDLGCAVLLIHHSNAAADRERGHSALRGNSDVGYKVIGRDKDGVLNAIEVVNDKQRDDKKAEKLQLSVRSCKRSLVISLGKTTNVAKEQRQSVLQQLKKPLVKTLIAFATLEDQDKEKTRHSAIEEHLDIDKSTVHRHITHLKKYGLISTAGQGHSRLTLEGRELIDECCKTENATNATPVARSHTAPLSKGAGEIATLTRTGKKQGRKASAA